MDEYRRITENSRALTVTLELDQAEYLPGENICVKISVANRTARPLEVFAPFQTKHQTRLSLFGYRGSPSVSQISLKVEAAVAPGSVESESPNKDSERTPTAVKKPYQISKADAKASAVLQRCSLVRLAEAGSFSDEGQRSRSGRQHLNPAS
jgi:hypothetical protein